MQIIIKNSCSNELSAYEVDALLAVTHCCSRWRLYIICEPVCVELNVVVLDWCRRHHVAQLANLAFVYVIYLEQVHTLSLGAGIRTRMIDPGR